MKERKRYSPEQRETDTSGNISTARQTGEALSLSGIMGALGIAMLDTFPRMFGDYDKIIAPFNRLSDEQSGWLALGSATIGLASLCYLSYNNYRDRKRERENETRGIS
jgi:hypothetical protein